MTNIDSLQLNAFILHGRNYRDTSLILDLLTLEAGRFSVVVRGARSTRSRVRDRLQPFTPVVLGTVGRADLKTATAVDFPGRAFDLRGDRLLLGLYVNELLYRLLGRHEPMKNLFNEYCMLLGKLESVCQGVDEIRIFELRLLEELGYGINFEFDAGTGSRIEGNLTYRYVLNEGFYRVEETRSEFFSGKELLAIANRRLNNVDRNRLRNLTRSSLSVLLGDKPLKSRDLFREISR